MSDTKEFWDEMWSRMDDTGSGSNKLLLAEVNGIPPGRALEIGCGTGGNALWLAKQGWQVTALDFSTVAVDKARKSAASNGVDVGFVVG
ncbi:MAG: class I SAM-dependent methyltransferase, partial [Chloroflexi bacterium]|nr:class I SAM-dependent methyltransferase [Chloroflexota bacterium]